MTFSNLIDSFEFYFKYKHNTTKSQFILKTMNLDQTTKHTTILQGTVISYQQM